MSKAKRVGVLYEDPSIGKREAKYLAEVRRALDRMGATNTGALVHESQAFILGNFQGGIPPETAASVIWHKHCSKPEAVPCVAECPGETAAACPPEAPAPAAVAVVGVTAEEDKSEHGLRVTYLPTNQAYALMWHGSVLRIYLTKQEAMDEKRRLLAGMTTAEARDPNPAPCAPFTKLVRDPDALEACRAYGRIDSDADVYRIVSEYLGQQDQEVVLVISIDLHHNVRAITEVARGQRRRVVMDVADIVRVAVAAGPHAVILCHNHPTGRAKPSEEDGKLTKQVREALAQVNLVLADHVVVGRGEWYSFADGKIKKA